MNVDVLVLFVNATLVTVVSAVIVIFLLKKQYLPIIKRMEKEQAEGNEPTETKNI